MGSPGGSWKGTGTPSCTDEPSGLVILVLSESSTVSSMFFRKLLLWFSRMTDTVTWLSFCKLAWISYVCKSKGRVKDQLRGGSSPPKSRTVTPGKLPVGP